MCHEGGCGCCVVSVTRRDLSTSKDVTIAVNSVGVPYVCLMNYGIDVHCSFRYMGHYTGKILLSIKYTIH